MRSQPTPLYKTGQQRLYSNKRSFQSSFHFTLIYQNKFEIISSIKRLSQFLQLIANNYHSYRVPHKQKISLPFLCQIHPSIKNKNIFFFFKANIARWFIKKFLLVVFFHSFIIEASWKVFVIFIERPRRIFVASI